MKPSQTYGTFQCIECNLFKSSDNSKKGVCETCLNNTLLKYIKKEKKQPQKCPYCGGEIIVTNDWVFCNMLCGYTFQRREWVGEEIKTY